MQKFWTIILVVMFTSCTPNVSAPNTPVEVSTSAASIPPSNTATIPSPTYTPTADPFEQTRHLLSYGFEGPYDYDPRDGINIPMPSLAVGPEHVVVITDSFLNLYLKDGTLVDSNDVFTLFQPLLVDLGINQKFTNMADPHITFDPIDQHFYVVSSIAESYNKLDPSFYAIAVSKTATPEKFDSDNWYLYLVDRLTNQIDGEKVFTKNWGDWDKLVINKDSVAILSRYYRIADRKRVYEQIRIFNKKDLLSEKPVTVWNDIVNPKDNNGKPMYLGINALGVPDSGIMFFVSAGADKCGYKIWGLDNSGKQPILKTNEIVVGTYCQGPEPAPQPNGNKSVIGFPISAVIAGNRLWVADAVGNPVRGVRTTAIHWFEVDISQWPEKIALVQEDYISSPENWYLGQSILADEKGNMAIMAANFTKNNYQTLELYYRLANDPLGSLRNPILLTTSSAPNLIISEGQNRISPYFTPGIDGSDQSFWFIGQYTKCPERWNTWITNFKPAELYGKDNQVEITQTILGPEVTCLPTIKGKISGNLEILKRIDEWRINACPVTNGICVGSSINPQDYTFSISVEPGYYNVNLSHGDDTPYWYGTTDVERLNIEVSNKMSAEIDFVIPTVSEQNNKNLSIITGKLTGNIGALKNISEWKVMACPSPEGICTGSTINPNDYTFSISVDAGEYNINLTHANDDPLYWYSTTSGERINIVVTDTKPVEVDFVIP